MKILVSGASGLVGSALTPFLMAKNHQIIKLVRTPTHLLSSQEISWDPNRGILDPRALEGLDAIIHLAGENIGSSRWTEEKKSRILDSRVIGTRLLCQALASLKHFPKVLVSASAIGYYGNQGDQIVTEQSPKGKGFLADVCEKWEAATQIALENGIRVVNLRIGMVLSSKGGGLKQMLTPFQWGLGGTIGSGQQYISWVTIDDLLDIMDYAIQNDTLKGPVNAVSPYSVTNLEFTKTLGRVLHRPTVMIMPNFIVRWAFGEMANEILLNSVRVEPKVLEKSDFKFSYPILDMALRHVLKDIHSLS